MDFSEDNLEEKLLEAGFDPNRKTFFSWLGISYYLTTEQISRLLASLARLSAQGSSLVFDFGDEGLFTSNIRRVQNMVAMAAAGEEPMPSCFSVPALEALLAEHGFLLYEQLTPEDIQQRFFTGQPKTLTAFPHICYANATLYHKTKGD